MFSVAAGCQAKPPDAAGRDGRSAAIIWGAALGVTTINDIGAALSSPWEETFDVARAGRVPETAAIGSCNDYLRWRLAGYQPESDADLRVLDRVGARCLALRVAQSAKVPSMGDDLRAFWDAGVLSRLPPVLGIAVSEDEAKALVDAAVRGDSWGQIAPDATVDINADGAIQVSGPGWASELDPLMWADFNTDGTQDLLLQVASSLTEGSWISTRVVILRWDAAGARFRLEKELSVVGTQ